MPATIIEIEERLWKMADALRANTHLRAHEYSEPVLGLIFLKFAYETFKKADAEVQRTFTPNARQPEPDPDMYKARGALYLPKKARYNELVNLPESEDIVDAVKQAMVAIEKEHPENLGGTLPKESYARLDPATLRNLLRGFDDIDLSLENEEDTFGRVYEYFLSKFALSEGQHGGEFFTPESLVRLIVEVIEPFHGLILDPACGSGGMFVQSAQFVRNHRRPLHDVTIYGQEKTLSTVSLCKMNLAVHGLSGNIKNANSYYHDEHKELAGSFDYVMANPPFNVNGISKGRLLKDHYPLGIPRVDNGNYLWINLFYHALKQTGRAGFVMPNSASDARSSEQEIRQRLIETGTVDVMIAIGPQFFYTVTLPCTLWFLDKGKCQGARRDKVLFIDARHIGYQVDRAHRAFTAEDIEYIANIVRLYRGEQPEFMHESAQRLEATFPGLSYIDVAGLCKVADINEIKTQNWSLNPGRYVGIAERAAEDFDFKEKFGALHEELERLTRESHELEERIALNAARLLDGMGAGE